VLKVEKVESGAFPEIGEGAVLAESGWGIGSDAGTGGGAGAWGAAVVGVTVLPAEDQNDHEPSPFVSMGSARATVPDTTQIKTLSDNVFMTDMANLLFVGPKKTPSWRHHTAAEIHPLVRPKVRVANV
jgi:hypothetical protein